MGRVVPTAIFTGGALGEQPAGSTEGAASAAVAGSPERQAWAQEMLTLPELADAVARWLGEHRAALPGFTVELTESPADRDPRSVWLVLESDDKIAELIVWTSGMADLSAADVESGEVVKLHREIDDLAGFPAVLDLLQDLVLT